MQRTFKYVVYKVTFPNGKIYIGKDVGKDGHSIRYFGSWDNDLVERDFKRSELMDFTLRKEILFESDDKHLVSQTESQMILHYRSADPSIGYNRSHQAAMRKLGLEDEAE